MLIISLYTKNCENSVTYLCLPASRAGAETCFRHLLMKAVMKTLCAAPGWRRTGPRTLSRNSNRTLPASVVPMIG